MKAKTIEAKHIFVDIVNYTYNRSVEAQSQLIAVLNRIVKMVIKEKNIAKENIIFIPTGDGMCISLLNISSPFDIHLEIAISILSYVNAYNESQSDIMRKFNLRIGINENLDNLIIDINEKLNISGAGINYASRIESLCDGGQILVGNSVFEKLVQREKYMNSFISYDAKVKHGIPIKVHQYKNDELSFLNNSTPKAFRPSIPERITLSKIQGYYLGCCIKHKNFILKNLGSGQEEYSLIVLMFQLAEDLLEKSRATLTSPKTRTKITRTLQEHFDYIQSIDFWIICDLASRIRRETFFNIDNCFSESIIFISEYGKNTLALDQPEIFKELEIKLL